MTEDRLSPERTAPELLEALRALGDEYGSLGVAVVAAAMTDQNVLIRLLSGAEEDEYQQPTDARICPDGGYCHHDCEAGCYRVRAAGPLTGAFPGDKWPAVVVRAETARDIEKAIMETWIPDLRNYGPTSSADWMRTKAAEVARREGGLTEGVEGG